MSKMAQLHAELEEQANEYGYENLDAALRDGCTVTVSGGLVPSEETLRHIAAEEHQKAHDAWLRERGEVIKGLQTTWFYLNSLGEKEDADNVSRAMKFIEEGEM